VALLSLSLLLMSGLEPFWIFIVIAHFDDKPLQAKRSQPFETEISCQLSQEHTQRTVEASKYADRWYEVTDCIKITG
jgi:uncharacterized cysteine cluster protein YcgN (CxxCxxCC family)